MAVFQVSGTTPMFFGVPSATITGGIPRTSTMVGELNRLAGITDEKNFQAAAGAANVWAGTTNRSLVDALHFKAGITDLKEYMDVQGICNTLAGIADVKDWVGPADALSRVVA